MCTRTSDWIASDGSKTPWSDNIEFKEYSLKGLEGDEAREIVDCFPLESYKFIVHDIKLNNFDFLKCNLFF